ncbi:hypothetical protein D3C85_1478650 [compost metagenome]
MHQHRGEQQVAGPAMGLTQHGVQLQVMRGDCWQAQRAGVATGRQHGPAQQRHGQHQAIEQQVRGPGGPALQCGQVVWQGWVGQGQANGDAQQHQHQQGQAGCLVQPDQHGVARRQVGDHAHTDEQHGQDQHGHQPVQQAS